MWTNDGVTIVFGDQPSGWRAAAAMTRANYSYRFECYRGW
jgi:hypothetical protein